MFELYSYYRVQDAHASALLPLVRRMQATLGVEYAVGTGLKRRPGSEQGCQTWMEIYSGAGAEFGTALARAATVAGIDNLLEGGRHTEVFMEMPACA